MDLGNNKPKINDNFYKYLPYFFAKLFGTLMIGTAIYYQVL